MYLNWGLISEVLVETRYLGVHDYLSSTFQWVAGRDAPTLTMNIYQNYYMRWITGWGLLFPLLSFYVPWRYATWLRESHYYYMYLSPELARVTAHWSLEEQWAHVLRMQRENFDDVWENSGWVLFNEPLTYRYQEFTPFETIFGTEWHDLYEATVYWMYLTYWLVYYYSFWLATQRTMDTAKIPVWGCYWPAFGFWGTFGRRWFAYLWDDIYDDARYLLRYNKSARGRGEDITIFDPAWRKFVFSFPKYSYTEEDIEESGIKAEDYT